MTREEFLGTFTDLIRAAFEHEGPDYGELLVGIYWMMVAPVNVRIAEYEALNTVLSKYAAMVRSDDDYDAETYQAKNLRTIQHLEKSEVWRLVRRRPENEWPDRFE